MTEHSGAGAVPAFPAVCAHGEPIELDAAFVELYASAFPRVYSFIRSQVGTPGPAQELVARVFLKAYRHRSKLPTGEGATIWLFRIARNTVIDYWRVEGRRESANVSLDALADLAAVEANPEALYAAKERQALLLRVMSTLTADDQILLGLKFTAQRTNREVAGILGITEAAVSMRLLRALRRLRDQLVGLGLS